LIQRQSYGIIPLFPAIKEITAKGAILIRDDLKKRRLQKRETELG